MATRPQHTMKRVAFLSFDWDYGVVSRFYLGLQDYLRNRNDLRLVIYSAFGHHALHHDPDDGAFEIFTLCDIDNYDGFLIQGNRTWPPKLRQEFVGKARAQNKPVVSINYKLEDACYVGTNNYDAMYGLVIKVLKDHKCTKPIFINGLATSAEAQDRTRAYFDACAELGITDVRFRQANWQLEEGIEAAHELLKHKDDLPDVAFCCNDDIAVGLTETLQENGIDIPGDIMVTGFDNRALSRRTFPFITTVDRDFSGIAQTALQTLERAMAGEEVPVSTAHPVKYVFTESCRYPAQYDWDVMSEIYNLDNSLKGFYEILSEFQSSVLSAESFDTVVRDCERFAPAIECRHFFLSLNGKYLYSDDDQVATSYGPTSHLMACAGPLAPRTYGAGHIYASFATKDLLPPNVPMDGPIYIVLPLHHNAACIGMVVIEGVSHILRHGFLTFFLTFMANSIESIRKRQVLQDANSRLDKLYVHDELTGLFNRFGLERYGTIAYSHLLRDFKKAEFIFVDIDSMKDINDIYGHEMGDAAICNTADIIRRATNNENAFAMRWGGDEFLLISRRNLVAKLQHELKLLNGSTNRPYDLSLSIGAYHVTAKDGYSMDDAIKLADAQMYEIKHRKKRRK